jgi:hypothetical protein
MSSVFIILSQTVKKVFFSDFAWKCHNCHKFNYLTALKYKMMFYTNVKLDLDLGSFFMTNYDVLVFTYWTEVLS